MGLPMQTEIDFPPVLGCNEKCLDLSDLSGRAVQRQTQHIIIPAIIRILNNIRPPTATKIDRHILRNDDIIRPGV